MADLGQLIGAQIAVLDDRLKGMDISEYPTIERALAEIELDRVDKPFKALSLAKRLIYCAALFDVAGNPFPNPLYRGGA